MERTQHAEIWYDRDPSRRVGLGLEPVYALMERSVRLDCQAFRSDKVAVCGRIHKGADQ